MADALRSLHPYPMAPFNIEDPRLAGLANVILRKKPDVMDEKWIYERLAKAQEFAHVPGDWNIEPKKPAEEEGDSDDDGDEAKDTIKVMFKRQKGTLNEDQISELWGEAGGLVDEAMGKVRADTADLSGSGSEASSPEDTTMGGTEALEEFKKAALVKKEAQKLSPMSLEVLHKFIATGMVDKPAGENAVV
jgi:hypothetical protein